MEEKKEIGKIDSTLTEEYKQIEELLSFDSVEELTTTEEPAADRNGVVAFLIYISQRIALMLFTLFIIVSLTFFMTKLLPGDGIKNLDKLTDEQVETIKEERGLNDPIYVQYFRYLGNFVQGDWGETINGQPVRKEISDSIGISALIGIWALLIGATIGITLGILAARYRNSPIDYFTTIVAVLGISIPSFVVATFLRYWFTVEIPLFPTSYTVAIGSLSKQALALVLPIIALSLSPIASLSRFTRTEMVETLSSNYVLLAKAKGVSSKGVLLKHAFRNSMISIVTILVPMAISLITGSLVIEQMFSIPGLGGTLVGAIKSNDINLIMGTVMILSIMFLTAYLVIDILYALIDPRIKIRKGGV